MKFRGDLFKSLVPSPASSVGRAVTPPPPPRRLEFKLSPVALKVKIASRPNKTNEKEELFRYCYAFGLVIMEKKKLMIYHSFFCLFISFSSLSFHSHIKNRTRSAFSHLCNINRLRPALTPHTAAVRVHSLVTSCIDYCNSLLFGAHHKRGNHLY